MILGPISLIDCAVFCLFLAPQLLLQVGLFSTVACLLQCLPFLLVQMPRELLHDRLVADSSQVSPFTRQATLFEDLVIRCVRYAFANIDARICRVFLSKSVSLPFLKWRMLRHGYIQSQVYWREYHEKNFKGIWIVADPTKRPDVVVYYIHGGGFSLGSGYFYLEFLMAWHQLLQEAGYANAAIFSLEYTLVPDASFPKQLEEAIHGYNHVVYMTGDPSNVVLAGDSAGGALVLSLLLHIGREGASDKGGASLPDPAPRLEKPGMAVLISPWVSLITRENKNTDSDYLDGDALHLYGMEYAGGADIRDPLVSPGCCQDLDWWRRSSPSEGMFFIYGEEEVFAPEARRLVKLLQHANTNTTSHAEAGAVHAWPVASVFLASTETKRLKGLKLIVDSIRERIA